MSLITISESIGCDGMKIAASVADELKLELYHDDRLEKEAVRLGIKPEVLRDLDEKAPGLLSRIFTDRPQIYMNLLYGVVYEVARGGQGIIMGHGSQVLLRDFGCALHVRIHASEASRIENLVTQRGLGRVAAEKLVRKSDNERSGFMQFAFHMDWNDPSLYDVVINRDKLGVDSAAHMIIQAARSQEIKECSLTALESMERLSLARRVQAAVLENEVASDIYHRHMFNIEVPEKGVVQVSGYANTEEARARFLKVVKDVPGVTEVRSEVGVLPPYTGE
jgi:cytidylate kinase